ncbi:hypothetical protein ACVW2L_000611 [Mucilaginibacter sp. HD30]
MSAKYMTIETWRGDILTADNTLLATSAPEFEIH